MVILIWCLAGLFLLLWTLAAGLTHTLLTSGPAWMARATEVLEGLPRVELLDRWWPGWQDGLRLAADALQAAFTWLGPAGDMVVGLVWAVWAVGTLLALALAALLSAAVRRLPTPASATGTHSAR